MNLPTDTEPKKKMVHALYCKCGVQYHVSTLDNALQSKDWNREVRNCLGSGGYAETFDMND